MRSRRRGSERPSLSVRAACACGLAASTASHRTAAGGLRRRGRGATARAGCDGTCRVRRHGRGARLRGLPKAKCADGATARADGGLLCLAFPRAFVIFVNLLYRRRYVWDNARLACFERELERLCGLDCCALCIRPFRICVQCRKASRTRRTIKWKHQLRSWRTIASR